MSALKIEDLIVGATYLIDEQGGNDPWTGRAIFVRANPPEFAEGVLEFNLVEDEYEQGYFKIGDVVRLASNPSDLTKKAQRIVKAIERDFTDRRGLRQEWDQIDSAIQTEIRQTWVRLVEKELVN